MSTPRVRGTDPATSHEAAGSVPALDWRVLAAAVKLEFFHDAMLAAVVHADRNIVARRRKDLEDLGFVERCVERGKQVTAVGPRGRLVMVFRVTQQGVDALRDEIERRKT